MVGRGGMLGSSVHIDREDALRAERLGDGRPRSGIVDDVHGQTIAYIEAEDCYLVHTLGGEYLKVPSKQVQEWTPKPPEQGGFDVIFPPDVEAASWFGKVVTQLLLQKGWCLVQMVAAADRSAAAGQALRAAGVESEALGEISDFFTSSEPGAAGLLPAQLEEDEAVAASEGELDDLLLALEPFSEASLRFRFASRTRTRVWLSGSEADGRQRRAPGGRESAETAMERLDFLRRRRLRVLYCLQEDGGTLTLHAAWQPGAALAELPLRAGTLLVLSEEHVTFSARPAGSCAFLQSWFLEDATVLGDYPPAHLHLAELSGRQPAAPIEISSMTTRLPGGVKSSSSYRSMLHAGCDGVVHIPASRFDLDLYCSKDGEHVVGKSYTVHGGFCADEDIFCFDNNFFGIPHEEVHYMAPVQRVVLETGYQCFHEAGHKKSSLLGRDCGVYIGDCGSDWVPNMKAEPSRLLAPLAKEGCSKYGTASRLSNVLGLTGPVLTIDTACSSALVAACTAVGGLRRFVDASGQSRTMATGTSPLREAMALGVTTIVSPYWYVVLCGPQMLSRKGRCFTFDEHGDGYERGEGCSAVYLKRADSHSAEDLRRQLGSGVDVNAVACLVGASMNQDGRSATLTAPHGPSQTACISASLLEAGVPAESVAVAECHGTGTALGDPIEVGALRRALGPRSVAAGSLPVHETSAKSNIGHLEANAGLAGLLKCVLLLQDSSCPANCHLRQFNPHIDTAGFTALFGTELADLTLEVPVGGVSSFGFSGTNARCDLWARPSAGSQRGSAKPRRSTPAEKDADAARSSAKAVSFGYTGKQLLR
eukprot:TRINITY_DN36893_c0_g1_i1.p1 TRINITY_DN36893_c0_g1~~TRINITY_DN36893_c0_g1_i1.p1  ORF type:complete len:821 (-),score=142.89 TRINITY_DN36893_c0_g1_i1:385-2847(-)